MRSRFLAVPIAVLMTLQFVSGADPEAPKTAASTVPNAASAAIELPGVHNAFRVTGQVFSGSQPEGDAAFAELVKLGVKTIISVDGSKPDVEMARKHGLRYVHLPFGYDGVPAGRALQLAQAAATVPGPIFVHCHHGKHRGPAAVGIICEATQGWTPDQAETWLKAAGTAPDYPGLYRAVREFKPVSREELAKAGPLPELTEPADIVDAMVEIDSRFDNLKALQNSGWKTPPGTAANPVVSPAQEATLLWEHIRESARLEDTAKRPEDYRVILGKSEKAADTLRLALGNPAPDNVAVEAAFKEVGQSCAACHKSFRNKKD